MKKKEKEIQQFICYFMLQIYQKEKKNMGKCTHKYVYIYVNLDIDLNELIIPYIYTHIQNTKRCCTMYVFNMWRLFPSFSYLNVNVEPKERPPKKL